MLQLTGVPTTKPRYTFTDTGNLNELLNAAARRWPKITDRKEDPGTHRRR